MRTEIKRKKNYSYFYVPNPRKVTINTYESVGHYNTFSVC
jgi:hypothetical protein